MADLSEFAVTRKTAATINTQTHEIAGKLIDSQTGAVLADFTGDQSLMWPAVLNTLTPEDQDQIVQGLANQILMLKAGL